MVYLTGKTHEKQRPTTEVRNMCMGVAANTNCSKCASMFFGLAVCSVDVTSFCQTCECVVCVQVCCFHDGVVIEKR